MELNRENWEASLQEYYRGDSRFGEPMKNHTSLAIGGTADVLTSPEDPLSFRNLMVVLKKETIPFFPLGGGTNLLVRDGGMEGVVISLRAFNRIEVLQETDNSVELFVEAGVLLQKLVNFCKGKGYAGIEGLTGIPGTVGGAICGNSGSFGYEVRNVTASVVIMNSEGRLDRYNAADLAFSYRSSGISQSDIVVSANLRFEKDAVKEVAARTDDFFIKKSDRQPIKERSAGCVFRNPAGTSAGKIIDEAGCKGMRRGGIEVSSVHANFFINRGGGTASDFLGLMDNVAAEVQKKFGVTLAPEIRIVGKDN
jgi:UDP-N-acetylmuramate dehydrogenase